MKDGNHTDGFTGPWWRYPNLRNALIAGMLAGTGFLLAHAGLISHGVEVLFYFVAIPVGGYHWAREAIEGLFAGEIGIDVGIHDIRAELKPEEKVQAVKELEHRYGAVLMVGDGINDAPALAAATCGVAMGVAGSDAAIEAADVALMADDLAKVKEALQLGRRVQEISRQNIAFSIVILVVLIPAAVVGALSVAVAVLTHEVSELLAVANGLRAHERATQVTV